MDRAHKAISGHYEKAMKDFAVEGLAPPPRVVMSGELPASEAMAQLMTLHSDCLARVRRRVPDFDRRAAADGPDMLTSLLEALGAFYHVDADEIVAAFALRDDPDSLYDRAAQPRLETGELALSVLVPESDAELERNGWDDRLCTVTAYATPYDPRLPLVRSRIGLRPDGIGWVSVPRPQNFQLARFDSLRTIHEQSGQWCLEFSDWRRRRVADRGASDAWEAFIGQLRAVSADAGFEWPAPTEGRREADWDAVIYNVSGWSDDDLATLAGTLRDAGIPHTWDGSDVHVPRNFEKQVDRIIDVE